MLCNNDTQTLYELWVEPPAIILVFSLFYSLPRLSVASDTERTCAVRQLQFSRICG